MGRKKKQAKLEGIGYDSLAEEDEETLFPPPDWQPERVGLVSRLFFHWVTPLIVLGKNRQINAADLPPLAAGRLHGQKLHVQRLTEEFNRVRAKAPSAPLFLPLLQVFAGNIFAAWLLAVTEQSCNLANPLLLRAFLHSFSPEAAAAEGGGGTSGYTLALCMLAISMLQTFLG